MDEALFINKMKKKMIRIEHIKIIIIKINSFNKFYIFSTLIYFIRYLLNILDRTHLFRISGGVT